MSHIYDGVTGKYIGTTNRKSAKQAKPTFVGKTVKGSTIVETTVIRQYRLQEAPIANRNRPNEAAMELGRVIGKAVRHGKPVLGAVAMMVMKELEKQMRKR